MKASFLFCLLITGVAGAQSVEWFPGIVTLESERVIKGDVSINYLHNVLLLKRKEDKGVSVLPAHKLQHVQYFDAHANKDRKFVSVRQVKNAATENRLLEEVLPGPVPVLRSFYSRKVSLHEEITGHHYYIWFQESLVPAHKFKSQVYPALTETWEEVERFAKDNGLTFASSEEIIRVLKYFNTEIANNTFAHDVRSE